MSFGELAAACAINLDGWLTGKAGSCSRLDSHAWPRHTWRQGPPKGCGNQGHRRPRLSQTSQSLIHG